jgi:hypothetical protein
MQKSKESKKNKNKSLQESKLTSSEPIHNVCGIKVYDNDLLHTHMKENSSLWKDIRNWD